MGVIDPGEAMLPCRKHFDHAMGAGLQHQLTVLAVRAFFDSQFADDPGERAAAEAFLTRVLPAERGEVSYAGSTSTSS